MEAFETGSNRGYQNSTRDVAESRKHPAMTHAKCLCLIRVFFERLGWELGGVGVGVG